MPRDIENLTTDERAFYQSTLESLALELRSMVDVFEEHVSVPERNCSCHVNPPCGDCVNWGWEREALASAKERLNTIEALLVESREIADGFGAY